jgi:hypothetical protein
VLPALHTLRLVGPHYDALSEFHRQCSRLVQRIDTVILEFPASDLSIVVPFLQSARLLRRLDIRLFSCSSRPAVVFLTLFLNIRMCVLYSSHIVSTIVCLFQMRADLFIRDLLLLL